MGLLGSALFTTLFMYSVVETELSEAVECRRTKMALFSQDKGSEQATVVSDSDCHHRRKRHIGQRVGVQQATEDAQCSAEEGVAVDSQTVQKHSNAERLNITKMSLDDNLSAQTWRYCQFQ